MFRADRLAIAALLAASIACAPAEPPDAADTPTLPEHSGPALSMASPADVGLSADGLARIRPAMQALTDDGKLPGIVTMVARGGHIVHWQASGMRDIETGDPLEPDDIFRIYSMSKPITSTAIMMLVESGDLELEAAVSEYIPELADLAVLEEDGSRVPAATPMTVENLLTHTGGLTYGFFGDTPVDQMYLAAELFASPSLESFVSEVAGIPLLTHPGTKWHYSVSTDVLGYIVQKVSEQPFEEFLEQRIFEPLGMDDTAFWVPPEKLARFTNHYAASEDGLRLFDSSSTGRFTRMPAMASGGGGLVSTASDYIRFAQMLLQEGELDGVRILQPDTVRRMRTNQLPDELVPIAVGETPIAGTGFGLGFATLVDASQTPEADHDGLFWWAGAANTSFWIDPEIDLIAMAWTQMEPYGIHDLRGRFSALVYEAIPHSTD